MSLIYPQNLMNSFLYRHTYGGESSLCLKCGREEEKPYHIRWECNDYHDIAIYPTAIKSVLCHEKTLDILFLERPQGVREIKFREFSSNIKGLLAVEYAVYSMRPGELMT